MIHKKSQPGVVDAEAVEIDDRGEQVAAKPERDNSRNRTVGIVADEAVSLEQELFSPEIADIGEAPKKDQSRWFPVIWCAIAVFGLFILVQIINSVQSVAVVNIYFGAFWGLCLLVLISLFARAVALEIAVWKSLSELYSCKDRLKEARNGGDIRGVQDSISSALVIIAQHSPELMTEFIAAVDKIDDCDDYVALFENIVLVELDRRADELIKVNALQCGLGVAALPHPALDSGFIIFRSIRFVREMAKLYGVKTTPISSLKLFLMCLNNALVAAVSGSALDAISERVVEGVAEKTASKLASASSEGVIISVRVFRMGQKAKELCRTL